MQQKKLISHFYVLMSHHDILIDSLLQFAENYYS
jgi:hypothetical protein